MAMEMMPQEQFAQPQFIQPPTQFFQPPRQQWQGTPGPAPAPARMPVASRPMNPSPAAVASQPTAPAPKFRAQMDDEPPPPRRLALPSPEDLGVTAARLAQPDSLDWSAAHRQLDRLGATCFHLEKTAQGGCLVTCLLPTNQQNRTRRIEAQGSNEAEAVQLVLQQAEEWNNRRK